MIIALARDPRLKAAAVGAAGLDEDVVTGVGEAVRALRRADPRLLIVDDHHRRHPAVAEARAGGVPVLHVGSAELEGWEALRRSRVPPPPRGPFHAARLSEVLPPGPPAWAERVLADLGRAAGGPLPTSFRRLARRVLEDPARYQTLDDLGGAVGLSPGAIRARFRRRDMPSPAEYLRWLRLLAVARRLARSEDSVAVVAQATGFTSSGNLARFTRSVCGLRPARLRRTESGTRLVLEFAARLLHPEHLEGFRELGVEPARTA